MPVGTSVTDIGVSESQGNEFRRALQSAYSEPLMLSTFVGVGQDATLRYSGVR